MKKEKLLLKDGNFVLNEKPFISYSGEIHYFRSPYKIWKTYLKRAKEAGLNTVSTYIPWRWHEYAEGKFDFTGKTKKERNLVAFLNMAEHEGLKLFLRVGPICHGEVIDDGLPGWLLDRYPEVDLKNPDGSTVERSMICFTSPVYRKFVRKWYEKVIPVIAPRQVSRGGNVALVQLDNEIGMKNWLSKRTDYSPQTRVMYKEFLKKKYETVEALNKVYGTRFKSFSAIKLYSPRYDNQPGQKYWDWASFWREYYVDYYCFLADTARSLGVETPLVANIAQFADFDVYGRGLFSPMTSSMFSEFPKKVDNLILGGAYQMRRLDYENFHDIAVTTEVVKMVADKNSPSICAELQTGIMFDKPVLYPSDVDLNIFSSCGHGLNGLNCYMFASGKNPHDMGYLGTYHKWQAPVALDGTTMPHFEPIKKWGKVFKIFGESLASSKKEADLSIGFYMPYYMTEYLKGSFADEMNYKRNSMFFDGICRLLELSGYNFKMVDLQSDKLQGEKNLVVFSLDFMDRETQGKIYEFVENGGSLIMGPDLPSKGLSGENCGYLRNKLHLKPKVSVDKFIEDNGDLMRVETPVSVFSRGCGETLFKTEKGNIASVFKKVGKGKVIAYGFGLKHIFNYHIDMVEGFLKKIGLNPRVKKSNRGIQTVMRTSGGTSFLFVSNYHQLDKDVFLSISGAKKGKRIRIPEKGSFVLPERTCRILPLNFKLTDEIEIIYTTSQILDVIKTRGKIALKLGVTPLADEEISFIIKKLRYLKLNGKKVIPKIKGKRYILKFKSGSTVSNLEIAFGV